MGGVTSFLACGRDQRLAKCANLDGRLEQFLDTSYSDKELLLIESEVNPTDTELRQWGLSRSRYQTLRKEHEQIIQILSSQTSLQLLVFKQSKHLNFTDLPLVFKLSQRAGLVGETDSFELLSNSSKQLVKFFSN